MKFFSALLVAAIINISGSAQIKTDSLQYHADNSGIVNRNPFSRVAHDLLGQFTGVFNINSGNIVWIGSGVVATAVLLGTDQGTYNTLRRVKRNSPWIRNTAPFVSDFGSIYGAAIVGAYAGFGLLAGNSKALETSYLAAESMLCSGIWTRSIKILTGRERPSATNNHSHKSGGKWSGPLGFFGHKTDGNTFSSYDAFPSGHTATAFSIATIFAGQYSSTPVVPVISYTMASLVGIARIIEDTHWASDVLIGGIIGYLTSRQILKNNPSEVSRREAGLERTEKKDSFFKHIKYGLNPFDGSVALSYNF